VTGRGQQSAGAPEPAPDDSGADTAAHLDTGAVTKQGQPSFDLLSDPDAAASAPLRRFAPGDVLDERYTIVEEVGAGGMGIVYKAMDKRLAKPVAIKLIRPRAMTETGIARFRRELELAQRVSHPNVCRLHDLGEVDGLLYISMQHVDGQRLDHLIVSMGHLSPKQTVALGRQLCAGLAAIHEQGIVHRDLKPSNIMVDRAGHLYIMDFGLAVRPEGEDRVTSTGAVLGTLAYLSPEQARGQEVGSQSDIFALGLILFEMLTGRCPPADTIALPLALREPTERCPPPSEIELGIPASLDEIILKCIARRAADRYETAALAGEAMAAVQGELSSASAARRVSAPEGVAPTLAGATASPSSTAPEISIRVQKRWAVALAVVAVLLVAGLGVMRFVNRPKPPQARPGKPVALAVMPFQYTGPDDQAYLKDLLPLLLTERLRKSADVETAPFSSTRTFAANEDVKLVSQQLGIAAALYGDLKHHDGAFDLTLKMLRPGITGAVWTRSVHGDATALVAPVEVAAANIARAVDARWDEGSQGGGPKTHAAKALALYAQGRTLLEGWDTESNYRSAAETFLRATAADETLAEAHAGLAMALWKQYEETHETTIVERSLAAAKHATTLEPDLPEGQLAMGMVQLGMGRSIDAASAFDRAQKLAPGDDAVCRSIASVFAQLSRPDEASRLFDRAIGLRPGYWDNYNAKGKFLMRQGKLAEAKPLFRRVIELRPQGSVGYSNLAAVHLMAGEPLAAEPLLQASLRIQPTGRAHNNLGFVYYATGRFDLAATEFRAAIDAEADPAYHGNLGDAYRQLGRAVEARQAYSQAIEQGEAHLRVNPEDAEFRAALSMWLAGSGRCPESRKQSQAAMTAAPQNPYLLYYSAIAATLCGDTTTARRYATRAMAGGGPADLRTNPDLRALLGT
jgi:serine/threonine-protein kinase